MIKTIFTTIVMAAFLASPAIAGKSYDKGSKGGSSKSYSGYKKK